MKASPYKFVLRCKQEIKEKIKIMIKQLGGEYIDSPNFVERCTHIVLGTCILLARFKTIISSVVSTILASNSDVGLA